ncbi:cytochrome c oxidase accessory protein CcoG [Niastella yeongjuensis]|uniref:Cytochrome c oxidase accessory protein CcoG n=1 Tax=Niastella yeongjuensis TaxID=354355 RepID=A0A1V9E3Y0_9BACT|nr:cytochrome c oxidase accessory protein CcoG [Niastella yeongjuensis]OQP40806.1 cytochrome c oxidase accessory protein CcoG [Niastella yeongjuensis]SEP01092.1 cytochrome c oxidase accessory protein FixG [Niastella yeongjuensis]
METESKTPPADIAENESFRDRIATVDASGKRNWVYAQKPKGKLYSLRTWISRGFFILFFALPFVYVHGRPLFLFDVTQAHFIIFGKVFWPQDFFIFGLAMVTFIVFVVLFTAAFGRLFCGWVCPQTIFMEMFFRKIEYAIEGNAAEQKLLAQAPWTGKKIMKKVSKHTVFFVSAFIIANFFLSYIISIKELGKIITEPVSQHIGGLFAILIFSGIFYAVYAFFREQACTVVCPYGRLQGVLMDRNSMIVAYDHKRGEPRGKYNKKVTRELGDCIDCFQCVKVCPTGIDIRNGTQLECVGCTACIDACNAIMDKINQPLGLIRYASENGIGNREPLRYTGRMKLYTVLLTGLLVVLGILLSTRKEIDATVMRTPGMLYQQRGTDSVSNLYNIKVANKTIYKVPLQLKLEGIDGRIEIIGEHNAISVKEEGQGSGTFFVVLPAKSIHARKQPIKIALYNGNEKVDAIATNFLGPVSE